MSNRLSNSAKYRTMAAAATIVGGTAFVAASGTAVASPMQHSDYGHGQKAYHSQHMMKQHDSQAAVDLRVGLNNLLREHVSVSLDATRAIASDSPQYQIDAATASQLANSDALAAAVGTVYGEEAQNQFSEQFREHIIESNKYAQAVADGDEQAKEAALMELQEYLNDLAGLLAGATGLPEEAVYDLLNEHEQLINESTTAFSEGDYSRSYEVERQALEQASGIADTLAEAIVSSKPDKF